MISTEDTPFTFPSKGSLWVPLPVKAVKDLANTGHRPAMRVFQALCLHLGENLEAVFPSYKTIAWYACVGQNSIRKQLNILEARGYISIEKRRNGRKFQNHYRILKKAWYPDSDMKLSIPVAAPDPNKEWICNTCWRDIVKGDHLTLYKGRGSDGYEKYWTHTKCLDKGRAILVPADAWTRRLQAYEIHLEETKEERQAATEKFLAEINERARIRAEEERRIREEDERDFGTGRW